MRVVRAVVWWALWGALVGTWLGALVARTWVPWFNAPSSGVIAQCACEPLTISTISHTLSTEFIGMVVGVVLFVALAIVFGAGRRKAEPPTPATPPASAGPVPPSPAG